MRTIRTLDQNDALKALTAMVGELKARGKAGVVAVADTSGHLLALLRMDGAPLTSVQIATNKVYTAARERRPSGSVGEDAQHFGDEKITGFQGGLPVIVDGVTVGAVGVSGLSGSEDEEVAQVGIDAVLARD